MPRTPQSSSPPQNADRSSFIVHRSSPAFTLIEILVVVVIIVILVGIAVGVGSQVKTNASIRSTHATLKTLEGIMKDYLAAGNPEPALPAPWPYPASNPPIAYAQTTPPSDPIDWVMVLRAVPEYATKLANLPQGRDIILPTGNITILDSFGTPIRYIPYNAAGTKKEGYFQSAGPDRTFTNENLSQFSPAPATPNPDDLYSTDP